MAGLKAPAGRFEVFDAGRRHSVRGQRRQWFVHRAPSRSAPLLSAANVGQHRTVRLLRQPRLRWLYASTLGGLFGLLVLYTGLGSLPGWADAAKLRLVTAPALLLAVPSGLLVAHRGPRGSLLAGPLLIGAGIVLAAVGLRGIDVGLLAAGTAAAAGGSAVLIPALITAVQQEVDAAAGPAARAWAAALYLAALFTGVAAASPVALVAGTRLPELLAALAIPTALSALLARQPRHR